MKQLKTMTDHAAVLSTQRPRDLAHVALVLFPSLAWWLTRDLPAWMTMWALSVGLFASLKLLTLAYAGWRDAPLHRVVSYLLFWPGLNAPEFLRATAGSGISAKFGELVFGLTKLTAGAVALLWAVRHVQTYPAIVIGWVGMIGIIFILHFGLLHVISWLWRRAGVNAPPLMRAPIASDSLASFWGGRWNSAFADVARRFLFKPTVRHLGPIGSGGLVFLVSGIVHEMVVSLPAHGGWGGPTLYFLLQGAGVAVEKSTKGKRLCLGCGIRGWSWAFIFTTLPLPLLFHPPFVHHVIVPFLAALNHFLP
jgi:hypothetical protein